MGARLDFSVMQYTSAVVDPIVIVISIYIWHVMIFHVPLHTKVLYNFYKKDLAVTASSASVK